MTRPATEVEVCRINVNRNISNEPHNLGVLTGDRFSIPEVFSKFRGLIINVSEEFIEVAIRLEQFRCRLFADTRHARQIVRRVSSQRGIERIALRLDTASFDDSRLVIEVVLRHSTLVVENSDEWILH